MLKGIQGTQFLNQIFIESLNNFKTQIRVRQVGRQVYFAIKLFTNLEKIKNIQLKYSTKSKVYKIMSEITQKELKKPYFHCGPIWKGKYQKQVKDFTVTNIKNKQK